MNRERAVSRPEIGVGQAVETMNAATKDEEGGGGGGGGGRANLRERLLSLILEEKGK